MALKEIKWWRETAQIPNYEYQRYSNDLIERLQLFRPTWIESNFQRPFPKKTSRIFVGSMSDIYYWKPEWVNRVIGKIKAHPEHTFLFLTKNPDVYDDIEYPNNCWLGLTLTGTETRPDYLQESLQRQHINGHKTFVSFEPLLDRFASPSTFYGDWIIIGAESGNRKGKVVPKKEWVEEIIGWAKDYDTVPVFLKDNLLKIYPDLPRLKEAPGETKAGEDR
jgi:protein gp37